MAAAARPRDPAAPPPPEVSVAANRTSGTPIMAAMAPGSTGAVEYSVNPSRSSTVRPASSNARKVALHAISMGVCGSDPPRL